MIGNKTRVKIVKNKLAPPFRQAEFEILYGKGVNRDGEVLDLALDRGLATRSGAWYSMGETQLGQGRIAACAWLAEHPDVRDRLVKQCIAPPVAESARPKAADDSGAKNRGAKGSNGKPKDDARTAPASPA